MPNRESLKTDLLLQEAMLIVRIRLSQLKNLWQIYQKNTKKLKKKSEGKSGKIDNNTKIALGKAVKEALDKKKADEGWKILNKFKRTYADVKENDPIGDNMVLNAAFLIDRIREKEFDFLVEDLVKNHEDRMAFKYVGPAPPFNFVNIVVKW